MQETRNNFFGSKKVVRPFVKQKKETRAYLFSPDEGSCYILMRPTKMEVSDSELRNDMRCSIKLCYVLGKIALKAVKLMK